MTRSLSETTLSESEFNTLVDEQLGLLRDKIRAFVKNPEPPAWIPPCHASPHDRQFLSSLRIPAYTNGNPSLLFHNLLESDDREISKIFQGHEHLCVVVGYSLTSSNPSPCRYICNTSGSGKT